MKSARGRGKNYSWRRAIIEASLRQLYIGDWPARAWARVPRATKVTEIQLRLSILPPGVPRLRVAFASDLHIGPTTPHETLADAFRLLQAAKPDVLALGGDYVFLDATHEKADQLEALVRRVDAPVKVAVLGNHDLWTRHDRLERALARGGVEVLVNRAIRLPAPYASVALIGVDDPWTGTVDAATALRGTEDATTRIAVAHAPDAIPHLAGHVHLMLSGHTHGGHVALPGHRPVVVPGPLGRTYCHGLHHHEKTPLFVSRGIGGIEVPVRTWARPDVVIIDLLPRQE